MNRITKWLTITAASLPMLSLAQVRFGGQFAEAAPVRSIQDILRIMDVFIGRFQALLFTLAVILILYAAFLYITSAGDPTKVKTAQTVLIYAAVGIGVVLLAYAVRPIVEQLLGAV